MPYYFSYDALIPNYIELDGFHKKEELHCTLAYSKEAISDTQLSKLSLINIPGKEDAIITEIDIFNNYIVLLIENTSLMKINKMLLKEFSIKEDHEERKMHVSIKEGLENLSINLKSLEDKYIGQKVLLCNPHLVIKDKILKQREIINLTTDLKNKKLIVQHKEFLLNHYQCLQLKLKHQLPV